MDRQSRRTPSSAFTLVELLVVIAIIGVLVALLLPAVQAARESARRSQCLSNVKQLGLAMQNYHDSKQSLPPGNYSAEYGTWQAFVLPFLEQAQLAASYKAHQVNKPFNTGPRYSDPANLPVTTARLALLTCPSDEPQTDWTITSVTFHNYVANYGNTNHQQTDIPSPEVVVFLGSPFRSTEDAKVDPSVPFKEITDGLSNTLLVGETIQGRDGDRRGATWWGWGAGFETYALPNSIDTDVMQGGADCNPEPIQNAPCEGAAGFALKMRAAARSRHPGGVQIGLCDGSAAFVSDNIDLPIWRAYGSTQGAEATASL